MNDMEASMLGATTDEMEAPAVPVRSGETLAEYTDHLTSLTSILQRVFSFPAMLGMLLVAGVFFEVRGFNVDPDLWWHLKVGHDILATHHWPTVDPYSFTVAGQPWLAFEWLGDVLLATVWRIAGVRGLEALLILLSASIITAIYTLCALRSRNSKAAFLVTAAIMGLATTNFNLRPQMIGYLFLVLLLIVLQRFRQSKRRSLWFLPLLFLAWINVHGSWVIGLGTMLVYWMSGLKGFRLGGIEMKRWDRTDRFRFALVFLLCLAVLPITPYGTQLAAYPFQVASSLPVNIANISEWEPMPLDQIAGKVFLFLILGFFALQIAFPQTWRLEELALLLFGTVMTCVHVRFLLIFVPFFAPLLATALARWSPPYLRSKDRHMVNAVMMFVLLVLIVRYFPSRAHIEDGIAQHYPVKAVEYLRQHQLPGPMFNSYGFGGYLVWRFGVERKVFIDGRGEPYEYGGVLADYMHITLLKPGALSVLRSYGVKSCLVNRNEPLANVLAAMPDWQLSYSDAVSLIFVRRSSSTMALAKPARSADVLKDQAMAGAL
jgi:hypothetical protein